MRVVLDANVLISAVIQAGPSYRIVSRWLDDADDDYLVALARQHDADYIVTGDKDLLEWDDQVPPAITPAAFEDLLSAR